MSVWSSLPGGCQRTGHLSSKALAGLGATGMAQNHLAQAAQPRTQPCTHDDEGAASKAAKALDRAGRLAAKIALDLQVFLQMLNIGCVKNASLNCGCVHFALIPAIRLQVHFAKVLRPKGGGISVLRQAAGDMKVAAKDNNLAGYRSGRKKSRSLKIAKGQQVHHACCA